ncbi:MAG TPA: helix-turn-helix domain-containing protein [candidate division Zixibacteria bacterium]|nr:helix-turn-helix domain-containing protein [candidate division Zixibacteria bacterium]
MTAKSINQETPKNEDRTLTAEDRSFLSQVAATDPSHSSHAQMLLAIDDGVTQAEAGRQAGLTFGQVRYWLAKFRKDGTSIFSDASLTQEQPEEVETPESSALQEDAPEVTKQPEKKQKKAKKQKKVKKEKKAKKPAKKPKKKGSRKSKKTKGKSTKKGDKKRKK